MSIGTSYHLVYPSYWAAALLGVDSFPYTAVVERKRLACHEGRVVVEIIGTKGDNFVYRAVEC